MLAIIFGCIVFALSSSMAQSATVTVSPGGDIQTAIDSATAGDTISIAAGTYDIGTTINVNKELTITGAGGGTTVVRGTGGLLSVFEITSGNVSVQNLEITLDASSTHAAQAPILPATWVYDEETDTSLIRITTGVGLTGISVSNNSLYVPAQPDSMSLWGHRAITAKTGTVSGLSISGNTIYNTRNGVVIQYNNTATVSDNSIYNTKGGIMNYTGTQADADNRTMSNNTWGTVHNEWDIVWNSAYYVPDYQQSVLALSGANNEAYVLDRRAADALACASLTGNRSHVFVDDGGTALAAHPAKGNFNEQFVTIALGLDAVVPGGKVIVADGTYAGNNVITKSVNLLGDPGDLTAGPGSNAPVVDGGSAPGSAFFIENGVSNVTIQGFEMRNFTSNDNGVGNGISAWEGSTSNITVQDNYFHNLGYNGVLVGNDKSSNPANWGDHNNWNIKGNILETFEAYGFELTNASNSSIEDNVIHSNATLNLAATCIMVDARRNESGIIISGNQIDGEMYPGFPAVFIFANDFETPGVNLNDVLIESNTISTTGTTAQVMTYNYAGAGTVTGVHAHGNNLTSFKTNTPATVDATANWWGDNNPADNIIISGSGSIDYSPWLELAPGSSPMTWGTNDSIQEAITAAGSGDTINVAAGTYTETGQIIIDKNLSVVGADKATTIIKPGSDTVGTGDSGSWFLVNDAITFNLSKVTLDGIGRQIRQGIRYNGSGTVDDTIIQNIVQSGYMGFGIAQGYTTPTAKSLTVTNSTFTNFGRVGIQTDDSGAGSTNTISGNTFTGKGIGDHLDYAIAVEGGSHTTITGNTITNCRGVASVDGSVSAAIEASTYFAPGTMATIIGNTLTGNSNGILVGYDGLDTTVVAAHNNNISGNTDSGVSTTSTTVPVDASSNWWGSASGPGTVGPGTGDMVSTNVIYSPWLSSTDLTAPAVAYVAPVGTINIGNPTVTATALPGGAALSSAKLFLSWTDSWGSFQMSEFNCTLDNGAVSCPTTGLPEGTYTATVTVFDSDGKSGTATGSFTIDDTTAPVTTDDADSNWHNTDVTVTLSCTDDISGCSSTSWSADNGGGSGSFGSGGGSVTITNTGTTTITYHSVDAATNVETDKTATVLIDKADPVTTDNADSNWHNHDVTITLSCTDDLSGCASTSWSTNQGESGTGTTATVTVTGDNTLTFSSTDVAGNIETAKTAHVYIDKVNPTITYTGPTGTVHSFVGSISASASDVPSGLLGNATLSLDGGVTTTACTVTGGDVDCPVTLANGTYAPVITVTDLAGNSNSATGSFTYAAHGKPELTLTVTRVYWASYADYLARSLSAEYRLTNSSVGPDAINVEIAGAINTAGVVLISAVPVSVGDILSAADASFTLKYSLPGGVTNFKTSIYVTASDPCGTGYTYPGPYPGGGGA